MLFGGSMAGGSMNAAQTMTMKYIDTAFGLGQYGYGSAIGYAIFLIVVLASTAYFFLLSDSLSWKRGKK